MKEWFKDGRYVPAAQREQPRPCGCGECGLTIPRIRRDSARRWAVGCPNYPAIARAQHNGTACERYKGRRAEHEKRSKYN